MINPFKYLFGIYGHQHWQDLSNATHKDWWRDPGLRASIMFIMVIYAVQVQGGYDKSLINVLQSCPDWKIAMGSPEPRTIGLITVSLNLGGILMAVPSQFLMDKMGRKYGLLLGLILLVIGAIIQTSCNGIGMFIGGRALIGAGIAASLTAAPILCQELAHPRHRGVVASLYNTMWYVGAIFVSWIGFGTSFWKGTSWNWRLPTLGQVGPSLFVLIFWYWLPESPRWLVSKGRNDEALAVLAKYHSNGDVEDELVRYEFAEIQQTVAAQAADVPGWSAVLKDPANRKRFALIASVSIFTNWNGQAIVSYYLSPVLNMVGITSTTQQTGVNGGLMIFCWLVSICGASLVEFVGRRKLWLTSFSLMLVSSAVMAAVTASYAAGPSAALGGAVVFAIFLYDLGFNIACNPLLYTYEVEVLPFHMRAKGIAFSVTFGNIQGVASQYSNPIGLANLQWRYYLVYTGFLIVQCVVIYFFWPETRGKTLEEVAAIFEGEEAMRAIQESAQRDIEIVDDKKEAFVSVKAV